MSSPPVGNTIIIIKPIAKQAEKSASMQIRNVAASLKSDASYRLKDVNKRLKDIDAQLNHIHKLLPENTILKFDA